LELEVKNILNVLGERAKIITDLIPESKHILGENFPNLVELVSENDEQKRFMSTIVDLISIFAKDGKRLSLFIDDLQWADIPSILLLSELLNQRNVKIFIIGAYRDNEVSSSHPLKTIIQPIFSSEKTSTIIHLDNLKSESIEEFLKDALETKDVKELSELTFKKTNGNPFFMKEFILTLYETKLISFDYKTEKWKWSIKEISETKFSDNVVDFMINNLSQFSEKTKRILNFAACIGNTFSLDLLAMIYEKSMQETYKDLLEPLTLGWIFEKDSSNFKFLHDRLQQSSYEIFEDKKKIHLKIGQIFLENAIKSDQLDSFIFEIVNNLNEASDIYQDKNELISLNLNASKVALKNFAFEPALKFSLFTKSLLGDDSWNTDHDLTFNVNLKNGNNYFLVSKMKEATEIYKELIEKSETNFEKLKTIVSYSKVLLIESKFEESLKLILDIFDLYDISKGVLTNNMEDLSRWSTKTLDELLDFFKNIPDGKTFLESIPTKANEEMSLLSKYMLDGSAVFFQTGKLPFACACELLGVKIGILNGFNETLPALMSCLAWYGELYFKKSECSIFGKIARDLKTNAMSPSIALYLKFYAGSCALFEGTPSDGIQNFYGAYHDGFEIGDYNWGSYSVVGWLNYMIFNGCNFETNQSKAIAAKKAVTSAKQTFTADIIECLLQTIKIIVGSSTKFEPKYVIPNFVDIPFGRFDHFCLKAMCLYILKDFKGALESLNKLAEFPFENIGLPQHYEVALYSVLVHFELYKIQKDQLHVDEIKKNCELIREYSEQSPIYFTCRYLLCQAILNSLSKDYDEIKVFCLFEDAIKSAININCSWVEALSIEYFSKFCKNTSRFQEYSKHLYQQAGRKWKTMGAVICSSKYIDILDNDIASSHSTSGSLSAGTTTSMNSVFSLDLESIIKSSNAISEDLDKKKLLSKLNQVIMENAGANKAFIILKENDKFIINSEIRNDKIFDSMEQINNTCSSISLTIFNQCVNQQEIIMYRNAMNENNLRNDQYIQLNSVKSVLCAPITKGKKICGVLYLENNTMEGAFTESRKFVLKHILSQVAISIENTTLYEDVKKINEDIISINEAYSRFLPTEFLKQLDKKDVRSIQPSESIEKNMTILFSDIRNFTDITDSMDAKESFKFVNEILNELAPPIRQNDGFVDKFIGDCVMAIFPNSPLDAVKSAIQMLNALKKLNKNRKIPVNIGIGIAYGSVMIGTLGYEKRLDATVISSTVNTASRMESLTKSLGVSILITEEVYNEIKSSYSFCYFLGSFYLKGQKEAKKLFLVTEKDHQHKAGPFEEAFKIFQQKKFTQAKELFDSILDCDLSKYYSKVCELYALNTLPKDWNGEIKISKDGDPQQILSNSDVSSVDKITMIQNSMNDADQLDYLYETVLKLQKKK
jgi:class 3 adenylate cyclase